MTDTRKAMERALEAVASSACPICGNDVPHRHATHEIEEWLIAQGNRFLPNGVIVKAKPAGEFVLIDKAAYDTPVCEYHGPDGDFRPFFKKLPGFNESCRNLFTHPYSRIKELEGELERLENKVDHLEWENKGIAEWRNEYVKMKTQRDAALLELKELKQNQERNFHTLENNRTTIDLLQANYNDLIYSVKSKFPNETRHETAKRYIKKAETDDNFSKSASDMPIFTTGHCSEHKKPSGCQLHNVQCGWPNCDRKEI